MKYYYIVSTGEGGASFERLSEPMLISRLNEGYWGKRTVWTPEMLGKHARGDVIHVDLMETEGLFIIHGEIIVPQPEKVVETWSVR